MLRYLHKQAMELDLFLTASINFYWNGAFVQYLQLRSFNNYAPL